MKKLVTNLMTQFLSRDCSMRFFGIGFFLNQHLIGHCAKCHEIIFFLKSVLWKFMPFRRIFHEK
jgi:hypothetical protein